MDSELKTRKIDYGLIICPMTGWDDECGDAGGIISNGKYCFLALVDALGHGVDAHQVAVRAKEYIFSHSELGLAEIIKGLHSLLSQSRGAVVAVCQLDIETGILRSVGIGNISAKIFGRTLRRIDFKSGFIGDAMPFINVKEEQVKLSPGDILIMSSDGLKEHYDINEYPGILMGSANRIASELVEKLGKRDDITCLVLRYGI